MSKTFKIVLLINFLINIVSIVDAQSQVLMIQGTSPGLHLTHTVASKENWYSVGRLYNISPKEIAPFNGVLIDKPLSIGEQIKIPLTTTNFSQNGLKEEEEVFIPVYHIIQEKEWMYRISTNYNKVAIEDLEKWNNINKDEAKAGTKLIIGYLKVKKDQSALAAKGSSTIIAETSSPAGKAEERKEVSPKADNPQQQEKIPTEEEKIEEKQAVQPEETKPVIKKVPGQSDINTNTDAGYFKVLYDQSGKAATGTSGIFKSTSGWQDGKYYALMNNVAVGTVLAVRNPSNNKIVYTKVLGQLPDMKESIGLTIRISDAAASVLEAGDARFPVSIKY